MWADSSTDTKKITCHLSPTPKATGTGGSILKNLNNDCSKKDRGGQQMVIATCIVNRLIPSKIVSYTYFFKTLNLFIFVDTGL